MKQQVVVIHGGDTFKSYGDFIINLKNKEVSLEKLKPRKDWKDSLQLELGDNFEVLMPRMPNSTNAQYEEWKTWFERITPLLSKDVILLGHSLGGIFLAKYLSENIAQIKVKALILVAAPFDDEESDEPLASFELTGKLSNITDQCKNIYILQSEDDPVVPFGQLAKYHEALTSAKEIIFKDRGHFLTETFPEMVDLIKKLP
jgi:predicted alpha/beta hydrolase family esterase